MESAELNFFSKTFNPSAALQHPNLLPPIPEAYPVDTLHQARRFLPPKHPLFLETGTSVDVVVGGKVISIV